jgi:zinc transporter, ZIP family
MLEAAAWGLLAGSSLVLGAWIAILRRPPPKPVGLVLGFGAGTLISAISFELTEEAYALGGADALTAGLALGAIAFYAGDRMISDRQADQPGRRAVPEDDESGRALLLGALLDGIPESAVLGTTLLTGTGVGVPVLAAIFLSNLPEGMGGAAGMEESRVPHRRILVLWTAVAVACGVAAGLGYPLLDGASGEALALLQAFAAGGVLAMLAIEMLPQAQHKAGAEAGLVTVLGFALAYLLSTL